MTEIEEFPHRSMTPDEIREYQERQKMEDDENYIEGKKWARDEGLDLPSPSKHTHDEYVQGYKRIHRKAKARYPNDVVAQNRFREGAKSWAGA